MAFCDLAQDMDVAEEMLRYVIAYVLEHCPDELEMLNKFVDKGLLEDPSSDTTRCLRRSSRQTGEDGQLESATLPEPMRIPRWSAV